MVIHGFEAGDQMDGIYIGGTDNGSNTETLIRNNIIYNIGRQAINLQGTAAEPLTGAMVRVYSNTVYNARSNPQNANSRGLVSTMEIRVVLILQLCWICVITLSM
jgi:hypothetical protein